MISRLNELTGICLFHQELLSDLQAVSHGSVFRFAHPVASSFIVIMDHLKKNG